MLIFAKILSDHTTMFHVLR